MPLHTSSLLFLVGGGRSPRYPPNKVILWDDALEQEVAELEFRERVRGLACRKGWLAVALRRRVVVFELGTTVSRYGEWDTCDNPRGAFDYPMHPCRVPSFQLYPFHFDDSRAISHPFIRLGLLAMATAAYSTLLAIPGRQMGHVHLIHLPPCAPLEPLGPPASATPKPPLRPAKHPVSMFIAHESALTTLTVPPSGNLVATSSSRGTLIRIWDSTTGKRVREFRRGTDKAEIYGVAFRPDEREVCVWSDKGTIHVFALADDTGSS